MKFIGTPGDDDLVGTSGDDQFNMTQGGNDTVDGGAGNDIFSFGATFNLNDKLEGGTGNDTLVLSGDYSGGLYMSPTVLHGVEKIQVQVGHSYDLGFYDGVIDHGSSLTVNATGLAVTDSVYVDGGFLTSASADTKLVVDVGAGPARFVPGPGVNVFHGGSGQAIVYFAGQFNSSDQMDGGTSNVSEINLNGDYSTGLIITATMMHNFSELAVENGFNYNLTTADACVAAGQQLAVNAYALGAGSSLTFNGSHETDGGFNFTDGAGNDVLTGGAQHDFFYMVRGGADKVSAGGGDDGIEFDNTLTSADHINGGAGNDYLELSGDYSAGLKFGATTMINVETLLFNPGHFKLVMDDGNVAAGQQLSINSTALGATDSVYIDASRETDGTYDFHGSVGVDTFIGGQAGNKFFGGLGSDRMTAGAGIDTFTVTDVGESTGLGRDVITGFDALQDRFDFNGIVTGIDSAVTTGVLRNGHFDSDLAHYIDSAHLGAQHAVLYTPDSGDWAGHTFLVVDVNGTAGYQAGQDMVFQLESGAHLANLSTSDFI